MWRSDDASRCVSASTIGDDIASCDELARTTDVGGVYRRLTNQGLPRLRWLPQVAESLSGVKDRTGVSLQGGFLCLGVEYDQFLQGELRFFGCGEHYGWKKRLRISYLSTV